MVFKALQKPFAPHEIEWRILQAGKSSKGIYARIAAYLTSRAVMDRLDEVVGPAYWKDEYQETEQGEFLCKLSIKIDDEWVTKWDGAERTDKDAFKGGLSDAFKRAGVKWGIGRYLYSLGEQWAIITDQGQHHNKTKDGEWFKWNPPKLPDWALPEHHGDSDHGNKDLTYRDITSKIKSIMVDWTDEEKKPFQDMGSKTRKSDINGWENILTLVEEEQKRRKDDAEIPFGDEPPAEPEPLDIF